MSAVAPGVRPAEQLQGLTLNSGWIVRSRINKPAGHSGSAFGVGYLVEKDGLTAFMKAIDFVQAMSAADPIEALQNLTVIAQFERDVLRHCVDSRMSRVVRLLDAEYVTPPAYAGDPMRRVFCLVMEVGEGDIRKHANFAVGASAGWKLAVLKDVALALDQLHRADIAHLDVKPSNVLSFESGYKKLCDLGRVVRRTISGPFDAADWPGDTAYSPPEAWYGFVAPEWANKRIAGDAYLLGSLLYYLFVGVTFSSALYTETPDSYKPGKWAGTYQEACIVLLDKRVRIIRDTFLPMLPENYQLRDELHTILLQLTHPDPMLRGDPAARRRVGNGPGIDRYISRFDRLHHRASILERNGS